MILRKTVLAAGALVALLASASVGSARPTTPAANGAAAPVQCSTKLNTLRPHYPDPVKPLAGAAGVAERRGLDVRRSDHVDVGFGLLEEGHERRLPGDRLRWRRRADQRADGRFRRQRHADARHRAGGGQGRPDPAHPARARRGHGRLPRQGRRLGPEFRRPDDRQDLRRRDHQVERPGHQVPQSEGEPPRRGDRGRPPLGLARARRRSSPTS